MSWCIARLLPDKLYLRIKFRRRMGYWMDFKNPKTFSEKMQWLKINCRRDDFTVMVDKAEVKKYVAQLIGEEYVVPTLGIYNSVKEIDFGKLPEQFVLKCTHDCCCNVICNDKSQLDKEMVLKKLRRGLKRQYDIQNREYPYKNVQHRIIAEKFLSDGINADLIDYKFFCFNGETRFCQVIATRSTDETIDFYDRCWNHQEFIGLSPDAHHASAAHHEPGNYNEMWSIADKLASAIGHPFVRIDLYSVKGKTFFGEITFFPFSGLGNFHPKEWNLRLGQMIHIPIKDRNCHSLFPKRNLFEKSS